MGRRDIYIFHAPAAASGKVDAVCGNEKKRKLQVKVSLSDLFSDKENWREGWSVMLVGRSPLPLWYPRQPLQDITAIINSAPETYAFKKKRCQHLDVQGSFHDPKEFDYQTTTIIPAKSTSVAIARSKRLRKGFR